MPAEMTVEKPVARIGGEPGRQIGAGGVRLATLVTNMRDPSVNPDHDAVKRIGGEAPGGGPILSVGIKCQVRIRLPPPRIVNSAVVLNPARAPKMVLSGMLVRIKLLSGSWT